MTIDFVSYILYTNQYTNRQAVVRVGILDNRSACYKVMPNDVYSQNTLVTDKRFKDIHIYLKQMGYRVSDLKGY